MSTQNTDATFTALVTMSQCGLIYNEMLLSHRREGRADTGHETDEPQRHDVGERSRRKGANPVRLRCMECAERQIHRDRS